MWPGAMPDAAPGASAPGPKGSSSSSGTLNSGAPPVTSGAVGGQHAEPRAEPVAPAAAETGQPPILGRPASPFDSGVQEEATRSTRSMVLTIALVAVAGLAVCNGLLIWVYIHSDLSVVVTLGIFLTVLALGGLRNRGSQVKAIVFYAQFLLVLSAIVGFFAGRAGESVAVGILTGGITFTGLAVLSALAFWFYTGERRSNDKVMFAGVSIAIVAAMVGSFGYLTWDHKQAVERERASEIYVMPPEESVYWLIKNGQSYTGQSANYPREVTKAFRRYTCEQARDDISALFAEIRKDPSVKIQDPDQAKATGHQVVNGLHTATVTAEISIVRDYSEELVDGPFTWTFDVERGEGERYWRVCKIDRGK